MQVTKSIKITADRWFRVKRSESVESIAYVSFKILQNLYPLGVLWMYSKDRVLRSLRTKSKSLNTVIPRREA